MFYGKLKKLVSGQQIRSLVNILTLNIMAKLTFRSENKFYFFWIDDKNRKKRY